jgi:hypothetical protein
MSAADDQAERLEAATLAAREVLREPNSSSKALRADIREAREQNRETRELIATDVKDLLEVEVVKVLDVLKTTTGAQMRKSVAHVISEFDSFAKNLLGPSYEPKTFDTAVPASLDTIALVHTGCGHASAVGSGDDFEKATSDQAHRMGLGSEWEIQLLSRDDACERYAAGPCAVCRITRPSASPAKETRT